MTDYNEIARGLVADPSLTRFVMVGDGQFIDVIAAALRKAVADERERCAQISEPMKPATLGEAMELGAVIAAAIRSSDE